MEKKKNQEGFFLQFPPSALFQFTVRSVICFCFFPEDIIWATYFQDALWPNVSFFCLCFYPLTPGQGIEEESRPSQRRRHNLGANFIFREFPLSGLPKRKQRHRVWPWQHPQSQTGSDDIDDDHWLCWSWRGFLEDWRWLDGKSVLTELYGDEQGEVTDRKSPHTFRSSV